MNIEKMSERELRNAMKDAVKTVDDLMRSHEELLAGVPNIVCDFALLNECRIAGDSFLRKFKS